MRAKAQACIELSEEWWRGRHGSSGRGCTGRRGDGVWLQQSMDIPPLARSTKHKLSVAIAVTAPFRVPQLPPSYSGTDARLRLYSHPSVIHAACRTLAVAIVVVSRVPACQSIAPAEPDSQTSWWAVSSPRLAQCPARCISTGYLPAMAGSMRLDEKLVFWPDG